MDKKGERYITNIQCKQYEWVITNLDSYSFNSLISGEFTRGNYNLYNTYKKQREKGKLTWTLQLKMINEEIRVYLNLNEFEALEQNSINIKCGFQISNGYNINYNKTITKEFQYVNNQVQPIKALIIKSKDLENRNLKIVCSIFEPFESTENDPELFISNKALEFTAAKPEVNVFNNFKKLLLNEDFSDLTLKSKTNSFKVHKAILGINSIYFTTVLKNDMREKQDNVINMTEDDDIIKELINYMYTGEVQNIEETAQDLLIAADKYQLEDLKKICTFELVKNISVDDAVEWLLFAEKYNSKELQSYLIKYISLNYEEISKTEGFKLFPEVKISIAQVFECLL